MQDSPYRQIRHCNADHDEELHKGGNPNKIWVFFVDYLENVFNIWCTSGNCEYTMH